MFIKSVRCPWLKSHSVGFAQFEARSGPIGLFWIASIAYSISKAIVKPEFTFTSCLSLAAT
jgi:hypothetical protein